MTKKTKNTQSLLLFITNYTHYNEGQKIYQKQQITK